CSTAGVSRTNRRATAFSACSNSVSANVTGTTRAGGGTSVAVGAGAVVSDAIRTFASETWELSGKRSTNRVRVEMSLVVLRNDQAISAASGAGAALSATTGAGGGACLK